MPASTATAVSTPELATAFATFTAATARLEHEYAALRARVAVLNGELEEKNRLLAASVARERALEAQALRQSRLAAMGEMAAMLAHEVRNPLGAMELFTGLLLQDLRAQPDPLRLAREVARGITDLNHLVTNLLEFTRTQAPRRLTVDVGALAEDALRHGADLRAAHGIAVERRLAAPAAVGDPDLLRPVLTNLVRNALQAMPEGGTLTLTATHDERTVRIAIADTGPGIAPAEREAIFRPFYTTRARGTGLGLAVARDLVTAMLGQLDVESDPGHGATFTVTLPIDRAHGSTAQPASSNTDSSNTERSSTEREAARAADAHRSTAPQAPRARGQSGVEKVIA